MRNELFFGRQKELDEIITRIKYQNQSSVLFGESGFGKTIILKQLSSRLLLKKYKMPIDCYIMIFFQCPEFKKSPDYSPNKFWEDIFKRLEKKIKNDKLKRMSSLLKFQKEFDYFYIENFYYEAKRENMHTIFLLDDFDNLLANPKFDFEFLWSLKNLANNKIDYNFGLVVSTLHRLNELSYDKKDMSSPFINIFSNVKLGLFGEEDCRNFINNRLKFGLKPGLVSEDKINSLILRSNGIPFLLELLVDQFIIQLHNENKENICFTWQGKIRERIIRFCERCWKNSTESEKKFLFQLAYEFFSNDFKSLDSAKITSIQKKFSSGWKLLIQRGFCYHNNTVMELFPEIYTKIIMESVFISMNHLEQYKNIDSDYMSIIKKYDIKYHPDYQFLFE